MFVTGLITHLRLQRMALAAAVLSLGVAGQSAVAQVLPKYSGHSPLSQRSSPGLAARYAEVAGRTGGIQPVKIILDGDGEVAIYHSRGQVHSLAAPAQAALVVGHSYRLKVSRIPELPAVEIYPTIELIDQLHPPIGQADNFPIPVHITNEDIETALSGNLVTRVVYLEQPQFAAPYELDRATNTTRLQKQDNAVIEADRRGRPVAIVRLGGRMPAAQGEHPSFFGTGGPIFASQPKAAPAAPTDDQPTESTTTLPAAPQASVPRQRLGAVPLRREADERFEEATR